MHTRRRVRVCTDASIQAFQPVSSIIFDIDVQEKHDYREGIQNA